MLYKEEYTAQLLKNLKSGDGKLSLARGVEAGRKEGGAIYKIRFKIYKYIYIFFGNSFALYASISPRILLSLLSCLSHSLSCFSLGKTISDYYEEAAARALFTHGNNH